jgi:hypothetical protein
MGLQHRRKAGALLRVLIEERFKLRIFYGFGGLSKAFLAIFECFDQTVDRRNNFFLLCHINSYRTTHLMRASQILKAGRPFCPAAIFEQRSRRLQGLMRICSNTKLDGRVCEFSLYKSQVSVRLSS